MKTKFTEYLNENMLSNLRRNNDVYNDFLILFLDKKFNGTRLIREIFSDILSENYEDFKDLSQEEKELKLKQTDFYKDLEKIWNKYNDNYILNIDRITEEVNKTMDKYNKNKYIRNKRKKTLEEREIKKGIKRFDDLLIKYYTKPVNNKTKEQLSKSNIKLNDDTRLLYITDYESKEYPMPDQEDIPAVQNWLENMQTKYWADIEKWAEEKNYYLWSY